MTTRNRVEGIYYNSSDSPVFLEGHSIGGHDYVYLDGYLRVPGHFVAVQDPKEDPDAPETFRIAYQRMLEAGKSKTQEVHANSENRRSNVVPVTEEVPEDGSDEPKVAPKPKQTRARKGRSDTSSSDASDQ